MKQILLVLVVGLFLISLASAQESSLGTSFEPNKCIILKQSCASCSYINFTRVSYPNSSIALSNVQADKEGTSFNYTFCDTNTLGTYIVEGIGDDDGIDTIFVYSFHVGKELTQGRAIGYIGFIIILLFSFFLTIYGAIKIRWKHQRNDEGKILTINNFRYLRILLLAMAYFELMFLFGLSYKIFNEAGIEGFTEFFNFIYQLFLNLIFPLIIFLIIVIFVIWINNKKLHKRIKLGLEN